MNLKASNNKKIVAILVCIFLALLTSCKDSPQAVQTSTSTPQAIEKEDSGLIVSPSPQPLEKEASSIKTASVNSPSGMTEVVEDFESYADNSGLQASWKIWEPANQRAEIALETILVNDGKKALSIKAGNKPSKWATISHTFPQPVDWSDSSGISFWVFNNSDKEMSFNMELMDNGEQGNFNPLGGGYAEYYSDLGQWEKAAYWGNLIHLTPGYKGYIRLHWDQFAQSKWMGCGSCERVPDLKQMTAIKVGYDPYDYSNNIIFDSFALWKGDVVGVKKRETVDPLPAGMVSVKPEEYKDAFSNPLKGFRPYLKDTFVTAFNQEYATLGRYYVKWLDLEDTANDGVDKMISFFNTAWKGVEAKNIKVVPRVYLEYPGKGKFWPNDLQQGDYTSPAFKERLVNMIRKLGAVWDNDPRVAYIEMGLIGQWGEQHDPSAPAEIQTLMGDAFKASFKNKLVMIRYPMDFNGYTFGVHLDSFAHADVATEEKDLMSLGDRWKFAVIGGETAYDWGGYKTQPGENPNNSLSEPVHRDYILDRIRGLHVNHLGWISDYNAKDPEVEAGAALVQNALGYQFVINEFRLPEKIVPGQPFKMSFSVKNTGSSPFYYNWPVELSLLDPINKQPVWKSVFTFTDIRNWLPGDNWDDQTHAYKTLPADHIITDTFTVPENLKKADYILAISILDPAGNLPSARFAIQNYYNGGRQPIGKIGVGTNHVFTELPSTDFDDLKADKSLHYKLEVNKQ